MTTAAERLIALSGPGDTSAGARLRRIGLVGLTAGALLAAYSGLSSATAAEHLLVDHHTAVDADTIRVPATGVRRLESLEDRREHAVHAPRLAADREPRKAIEAPARTDVLVGQRSPARGAARQAIVGSARGDEEHQARLEIAPDGRNYITEDHRHG